MYLVQFVQFWSQTKLDGLLQSLDVQEHPKVMDLWTKRHTSLGKGLDQKNTTCKIGGLFMDCDLFIYGNGCDFLQGFFLKRC